MTVGTQIIEVWDSCDMVKTEISRIAPDNQTRILTVIEDKFLPRNDKKVVLNMPNKFPMISKPKAYSKDSKGGYLLNDVKF